MGSRNRATLGGSAGMALHIAMGLVLSLGLTAAVCCLSAYLVSSGKMSESAIGYGAAAALLISSAGGAMLSAAKIGQHRMPVCLISGAVYFLSLLCCTALFFEGRFEGVGISALLILGGSGAAGLVGLRQKRSRRPKLKKYASR